jgi:Flp pilus assembly protein TadG
MVELAIAAPILVLLMFAVVDLGRAFYQYNVLSAAVRDGARYYSTHPADAGVAADTRQRVLEHTAQSNAFRGMPAPTVPAPAVGADQVTVSATYTYQWITPLPRLMGLGGSPTLSASSTLRLIP